MATSALPPIPEDLYKRLGVSRTASPDQIKRAYRRLAKFLHPDVNHDPEAVAWYDAMVRAYHVLSDVDKRRDYDEPKPAEEAFDFEDMNDLEFEVVEPEAPYRGTATVRPTPRPRPLFVPPPPRPVPSRWALIGGEVYMAVSGFLAAIAILVGVVMTWPTVPHVVGVFVDLPLACWVLLMVGLVILAVRTWPVFSAGLLLVWNLTVIYFKLSVLTGFAIARFIRWLRATKAANRVPQRG